MESTKTFSEGAMHSVVETLYEVTATLVTHVNPTGLDALMQAYHQHLIGGCCKIFEEAERLQEIFPKREGRLGQI